MAANIPAVAVVATKQGSGNVQLVFFRSLDGLNAFGEMIGAVVIPSADFTAFNTTVNGGGAGTALTKVYAQNANASDYPQGYTGNA